MLAIRICGKNVFEKYRAHSGVIQMSGAHRRLSELAGASICRLRDHRQRLHQSWLSRGGASAFQVRHLKQMEVILTERIKNVGEAGEIVKVAPGYARNYLCPQLKAMPAISKYIALVRQNLKFWPPRAIETEADEAERKAKEEMEKQKEIDKMLRRLDTGKVVVYRIVLDKTNLRYFVSSKDLVPLVRRQMNIELTEAHIDLPTDISTLGEFEVPLRLPPNLPLPGGKERLFLKVRVRRKNRIHNTQTVPKVH